MEKNIKQMCDNYCKISLVTNTASHSYQVINSVATNKEQRGA